MKRRMPRRSWASGRGALTLVALILLGSAIIRVSGSGAAIALELTDQFTSEEAGANSDQTDTAEDLAPELIELLSQTRDREKRLAKREAALEALVQALSLI